MGTMRSGFYKLRWLVLERDNFACRYCGRTPTDGVKLHADHVMPRASGGPDTMSNLVAACEDCNRGKKDRSLLRPVPPPHVQSVGRDDDIDEDYALPVRCTHCNGTGLAYRHRYFKQGPRMVRVPCVACNSWDQHS